MRIIKIKKVNAPAKDYANVYFSVGFEYTIADNSDLANFIKDTTLLADILLGDTVINDGTSDLDSQKGYTWLVGNLPQKVTTTGVNEPDGKRARLVGLAYGTILSGETKDFDYKMEQLQHQGQTVASIFNGIQYYAKDANVGDTATFQIVDVDGIVYPAGTVLEEFSTEWNMIPNHPMDIILYRSAVIPGFYIRIKYASVGPNDTAFCANLYRHMLEN